LIRLFDRKNGGRQMETRNLAEGRGRDRDATRGASRIGNAIAVDLAAATASIVDRL
jgi:hypothetical protein